MQLPLFRVLVSLHILLDVTRAVAAPDAWVQAQQSFTRLDFANAYKNASLVLSRQPANIEARRIAAKSARELGRLSDCLRLSQEIPLAKMDFDDVGLVGECSVRSSFTPRAQSILQNQLQSPENRDIAAYWIGRYLYLKEDYRGAEKQFSVIQILPDRLEKERQKMLERIREVMAAAAQKQAQPVVVPKPVSIPEPAPTTKTPSVVTPKPMPAVVATPKPVDAPDGKIGQYLFAQGSFRLNSELSSARDMVNVDPFTQTGFEKDFSPSSIKTSSSTILDGSGSVSLRMGLGSRQRVGQDSKVNLLGAFEFDATMANRTIWLYQPISRLKYPLGSVGTLGRGVEFGGVPEVQFAFGSHFEGEIGARAKLNVPDTNRMRTLFDFHGMGAVKNEYFRLEAQYIYDRYYVGSVAAFTGYNASADLRIDKAGIFGLGAPPGYALFRYARYVAIPSKHIVRFNVMEGDFVEFNVAPRLQLLENVDAIAWYHWVRGTRRQFWSAKDIKSYYGVSGIDVPTSNPASYQPTALYSSLSSEVSTGVQWNRPGGIYVGGGVGWRRTSAAFLPFTPDDLSARVAAGTQPEKFEDLINAGGGTIVRAYANFGFVF